ncbi:MarR family winged helix-turn-helix transcriptional regulator [Streptomyces sp. NPDC087437]|uniref:MarR family winged helix-turn-helix transcriptional regulator n=1 Tax=Streptomyces sp. NPDC087437 TaxID=3365789 RepID=UPI00382800BC
MDVEQVGAGTAAGPPESTESQEGHEGHEASEGTAPLASDLRVAVARITRRLRQAHAVGDVSLSGMSVLARLAADGPDSPGSLAELERVRPQAMAATLAALEQRGLVLRSPHAVDRRRSVVAVTAAGRDMLAARRTESVRRLADAIAEFTPREQRTLAAALPLLDRLAERL